MDLLVLGYGWQGKYVVDYFTSQQQQVAFTTTSGRESSIAWTFNPDLRDPVHYQVLPKARHVLITFPLPTEESAEIITSLYRLAHGIAPSFVLLGSTRAFHGTKESPWATRHGPVTPDTRYRAEEWFLKTGGVVLNLAGLWGGLRQPKNWISRIAPTKEALARKTSVHLIHGLDVARLTFAITQDFTPGQRWIVTDLHVYDWYSLILELDSGDGSKERNAWILELLAASPCRALPRQAQELDRALDAKEVGCGI
ncbi:hypothetical protein HDV03_001430 [Kappamyces sp. JEL0829]|nr:hypothetical protein HDV03_001430 [Kappamyces sp. JEL0829]